MYEFHGWAAIRETYGNFDGDEDNINSIVKDLKEYIKKLDMFKLSGVNIV